MPDFLLSIIAVFGAVFLFGFAIFIHELGHFLVAKMTGVGVSKFAVGFGPKIVSFSRGGTEYSLRWIPLGGFVALKGMIEGMEDEEPAPEESPSGKDPRANKEADSKPEAKSSLTDDLDALRHKSPLVRIGVFIAGVTCNYLTAIVFMVFYLSYGSLKPVEQPSVVKEVPEASQLYALGWRSGDRIVAVDLLSEDGQIAKQGPRDLAAWNDVEGALGELVGVRFQTLAYVREKLGFSSDAPTSPTFLMTVQRQNEQVKLPLTTRVMSSAEEMDRFFPDNPPVVHGMPSPNSPAGRTRLVRADYTQGEEIKPFPLWDDMKAMPLEPDDTILAVNATPVASWSELVKKLRTMPNEQVLLTVLRKGSERPMLLSTTLERSPDNPEWGYLGVAGGEAVQDERDGMPIWKAALKAPMATLVLTDRILYQTVNLFATASSREIKRNLGGPVAITVMAYQSAKRGLEYYLRLFVAINIVLAIMNLLPIPVLDGGYILITIIEAIIRRPVPQKIMVPLLTTFMALFFILFAFIFFNDFMNLFYRF